MASYDEGDLCDRCKAEPGVIYLPLDVPTEFIGEACLTLDERRSTGRGRYEVWRNGEVREAYDDQEEALALRNALNVDVSYAEAYVWDTENGREVK